MKEVLDFLYTAADPMYKGFQSFFVPMVDKERIIGVRTPQLRAFARDMINRGLARDFIMELPHHFFEENQLHAFIISDLCNFNVAIKEMDNFLPYVDNWTTCDQMSPRIFSRNTAKLLPHIKKWIHSEHVYTVRFGILCLMRYFLGDSFHTKYADMVAGIESKEYYVNMARAWYFATAIAKQCDKILPYFENNKLDMWTHNRAIQKAIESYRILPHHKAKLKSLKRKAE